MDGDLIGVTKAAKLLGCRPQWVLMLIKDGRLKAEKPARDWVIKPKDLEAFQETRKK